MKKTGVLIVDDQRSGQQIMAAAIERGADRYRLFQTITNASFAELCCMTGQVDLILMDVYTEFRENGIDAAAKIKQYFPRIKIIIATGLPEESFIRRAKAAGCESFWYKDISEEDLLEVMDRTMVGESIYPESTPVLMIGNAKSDTFTAREMEVLREKVSGRNHQEICERLSIKKSTFDYHITSIMSKTGYTNGTQLAGNIMEQRFILPDF
jgi:DNA-binding NarL/FixJ family response regulator